MATDVSTHYELYDVSSFGSEVQTRRLERDVALGELVSGLDEQGEDGSDTGEVCGRSGVSGEGWTLAQSDPTSPSARDGWEEGFKPAGRRFFNPDRALTRGVVDVDVVVDSSRGKEDTSSSVQRLGLEPGDVTGNLASAWIGQDDHTPSPNIREGDGHHLKREPLTIAAAKKPKVMNPLFCAPSARWNRSAMAGESLASFTF